MTFGQAIALGTVQGLGEFLPISSSAHLKILRWIADWKIASSEAQEQAIDVALHLGTLVALLVYFRADILRLIKAFIASVVERRIGDDLERRLAWLVLLGSLPGALIGKLFEAEAEEHFGQPWIIAAAMIAMGIALYVADRVSANNRDVGSLRPSDAAWIGLAQACAIVPGVSRSGSTITAGRILGLDRTAAARFSFLLAAPIIAGAALIKVPRLVKAGGLDGPLLVAICVSALTGYLAIGVLLRFVRTRSYLPFVAYRIVFGVTVFVLLVSKPS